MREAQTRPGPVPRVLDQPRADRIAEHVAEDREEMAVLLYRKTFEAALPHMTMAPVLAMVAADAAGHSPLHDRAECVYQPLPPGLRARVAFFFAGVGVGFCLILRAAFFFARGSAISAISMPKTSASSVSLSNLPVLGA